MKWISILESQPKYNQRVLVITAPSNLMRSKKEVEDKKVMAIGYRHLTNGGGDYFIVEGNPADCGHDGWKIACWRPLPEWPRHENL